MLGQHITETIIMEACLAGAKQVKPESKLEIAERRLAEAEGSVARQKQLIWELERDGHYTRGSHILLDLMEEGAHQARQALATIKFTKGL